MKRSSLIAIGLTVIVAALCTIRALLFLHPSPGDGALVLHVRFQSVEKISKGSRVTFAGKPVGEVIAVTLLPETFADRRDADHPIYAYELTLAVDSSVQVYKTDSISIKTAGLMGERSIEITPNSVPVGNALSPVGSSDVIYASRSGSPEELCQNISALAKKAEMAMDAFLALIHQNQEGIARASDSLAKASTQIDRFVSTLNRENIAEKISSISDRTDQLVADIHSYGLLFHLNRDWQREQRRKNDEQTALTSAALVHVARQRFVKISQSMSELEMALERTRLAMGQGSLLQDQALREECVKGLSQVQQKIDDLQRALEERSEPKQ